MPNYIQEASITPSEVLAGDSVEFVVRIVAGADFSAENSRLILDMPGYLGTSRPTRMDQESTGFVQTVISNPDIRYTERVWDMEIEDFPTRDKTSFKGMAARMIVIDLHSGTAQAGDVVEVHWGFARNGMGNLARAPWLVLQTEFYNNIHVRYFRDGTGGLPDLGRSFKGYERPTPDQVVCTSFRVRPREPERLRVLRRRDRASLLVLDRFSNICETTDSSDFVQEETAPIGKCQGVYEYSDPNVTIKSLALPIDNAPGTTDVFDGLNVYFGDLHTHSMHSNDCVEREKMEMKPADMFTYARDVACVDFCAVTDHHQPWDKERNKIGEELWLNLLEAVDSLDEPGRFLALPGIEFRSRRGDTAVVFADNPAYDAIDNPAMTDVRELWQILRKQKRDFISIPHFHNGGGYADGEWEESIADGAETLLEIYSCHGSYESEHVQERHIPLIKRFRPDRCGTWFLKQGMKYGLCCNSDGHKGNPGTNGLTAVFAKELTREALFEAIRKRHVYGTTNARTRLLFTLNGALMGTDLGPTAEKEIHIEAAGEQPLKAVDLIRDGELYKRFRPDAIGFKTVLRTYDDGAFWYVRVTQVDNHIAYSSPIWTG